MENSGEELSVKPQPTHESDSESHVPYVYRPLNHEDSIRLLKVYPGPNDSPLVCDIIEVRRAEAYYEALSYVWGPPIFTHRILEKASRCYVPITENLFYALHTLRKHSTRSLQYRYRSDNSLSVWVDALCIDQSNVKERNHQVKGMAGIFSDASKVLVWLGPREPVSCFRTFAEIDSRRQQVAWARSGKSFDHDDSALNGAVHEAQEIGQAKATYDLRAILRKCNIVELGKFFANAWFTRAWVLQEFLLANSIDMFMGTEGFITFKTLASAFYELKLHEHLLPRGQSLRRLRIDGVQASFVYQDDFLQHFQIVDEMFQARRIWHANSSKRLALGPQTQFVDSLPTRTLYQWCRMLIDRKCADERDKIYAALGLAHNDLGIIPNYSLSVASIVMDLTTKSLEAGDFAVLHDAGKPILIATQGEQPSFVPSLRRESRHNRPKPLGGYDVPRYTAGLSRAAKVQSLVSDHIRLRGVKVDRIFYVDTFADALKDLTVGRGSPFKPELLAAYDRATSTIKALSHRPDFPDIHFKLAFWRTINLGFVVKRADLRYHEKGVDFQFLGLSYRQNVARCMKRRVFFITRQGFMGLAPEWAQKGDKVVIFDGAETPFLLRQAMAGTGEEAWRLVGDCYLEGWMIGDYFGCTIESGPESDEPVESKTYLKGIAYHDTEFRRRPLRTEFFTLC
jgi:hypothetical protein